MNKLPAQFAEANKASVEAMLTIANTVFASAERLAALNLNTARTMLEDSVANTKALIVGQRHTRAGQHASNPGSALSSKKQLLTHAVCTRSLPRHKVSWPKCQKHKHRR
jgi:hypothetical protein